MARRAIALSCVVVTSLLGREVVAQKCDTLVSRTTYAPARDVTIRSVTVRTDEVVALPFGRAWMQSLRRTTETHIVSRQLLFAAGDKVDSVRIAETLRRLRD